MSIDKSDKEINYEMHLKSTTGEISVYIIQPELAESYDSDCLKLRLQPEPKRIKRDKELEEEPVQIVEKKEEVKPKRKVGRYLLFDFILTIQFKNNLKFVKAKILLLLSP